MSGKQLLRLRKKHGLTQAEFASKIDRDQTTISKYETGDIPVPSWLPILLRGAGLLPMKRAPR